MGLGYVTERKTKKKKILELTEHTINEYKKYMNIHLRYKQENDVGLIPAEKERQKTVIAYNVLQTLKTGLQQGGWYYV